MNISYALEETQIWTCLVAIHCTLEAIAGLAEQLLNVCNSALSFFKPPICQTELWLCACSPSHVSVKSCSNPCPTAAGVCH